MMRMSVIPASRSRAPMTRPPKPPPATITVVWSRIGSRSKWGSAHGSAPKAANFPPVPTYWPCPSGRTRLSRSSVYFTLRATGSKSSSPTSASSDIFVPFAVRAGGGGPEASQAIRRGPA
jgi:hypothetical protein